YGARVKIDSTSGYTYYSSNIIVFKVETNSRWFNIGSVETPDYAVSDEYITEGETLYLVGGSRYSAPPIINVSAGNILGQSSINVAFGESGTRILMGYTFIVETTTQQRQLERTITDDEGKTSTVTIHYNVVTTTVSLIG
ncbi:MAG: hypothetical protein IJT25_02390, partial [Clostridia bacterium]|nr:hypothetical protein [Clostridia bacterium]